MVNSQWYFCINALFHAVSFLLQLIKTSKNHTLRHPVNNKKTNSKDGTLGRIRTSDRLVRSQVLYPAELRAHKKRNDDNHQADLQKMARPGGFEPPTAWFVARYSIQLSYGRTPNHRPANQDRGTWSEQTWPVREKSTLQSPGS